MKAESRRHSMGRCSYDSNIQTEHALDMSECRGMRPYTSLTGDRQL